MSEKLTQQAFSAQLHSEESSNSEHGSETERLPKGKQPTILETRTPTESQKKQLELGMALPMQSTTPLKEMGRNPELQQTPDDVSEETSEWAESESSHIPTPTPTPQQTGVTFDQLQRLIATIMDRQDQRVEYMLTKQEARKPKKVKIFKDLPIQKFDPNNKSQNWDAWWIHFDRLIAAKNPTTKEVVQNMIYWIHPAAFEKWYPYISDDQAKNPAYLAQRLSERYKDHTPFAEKLRRLFAYQQTPTMSVQEYTIAKVDLFYRAYPSRDPEDSSEFLVAYQQGLLPKLQMLVYTDRKSVV